MLRPSQVPKPDPNVSTDIDLPHLHRTALSQIRNHGAAGFTPPLPPGIDGDHCTLSPAAVTIWVSLRKDSIRDNTLLLLMRQQELAAPTQEKLLFLDHHIAPIEVPICNATFDAESSTTMVLNGLSICECCL